MGKYAQISSRAKNNPNARIHRLIVEKAIGRPLKDHEVVHHVNGQRKDNRPENLVLCPDQTYHKLLHRRMDAMNACGNPNQLKCRYCGQYDDPANIIGFPRSYAHAACAASYMRKRRALRLRSG